MIIETVTTLVIGDSGNVFLDGKGPNTQIEPVAGSSTESSISYETSLVTDTVDRDMYFSKIVDYYQLKKILVIIKGDRKPKNWSSKGLPEPPAEPGSLVTLRNDPSHLFLVDCVLPNMKKLGVRETPGGRKAIVTYDSIVAA